VNPENVRILLVDDSPDKLLSLGSLLVGHGREIVEAKSGREALRHLLSGEFAVILLDINMPGMDGFETAALVRQRKNSEHTPIIFITAYSDDIHSMRGYSLGAVDYIVTPVVPEVLQSKVAVFVELFRTTEQVRRQAEILERRASQLQRLSQESLAINSAGSASAIVRAVTAAATNILDADRVLLVPAPGEAWGARPPGETKDADGGSPLPEEADLTATMTGQDGRPMGILLFFARDAAGTGAEDAAILTQLAQMAAIAIENVLSAEAREANRLKDEFLATLSHELRTPLTAILGWARVLRMGTLDPKRHSHGLDVIERNVNAQAKLIEDLLEISRVSNSKIRIAAGPMRLSPVIEGVLDAMRPAIEAKGLKATFGVAPEAAQSDRIDGDPDRLQQVFGNLVSNAIKFTRKGGSLDVRVGRSGAILSVTVSDSGKGISPEFIGHVFDRFRQEDSSPTRSHGGLGIGLAIAKTLVELHGGSVAATSDGAGRGATFGVRLRLIQDRRRATPDESPPSSGSWLDPPPELRGLRVLVVDDDADARDVVNAWLTGAGAEVRVAATGAEALAELDRAPCDLVLSDVAMPGEDGYALLRKIRDRPSPRVPVIALTALARREDRARALRAGFASHVPKPVEPAELFAVVASLARPPRG
jgi:signal transduction histidine kinase